MPYTLGGRTPYTDGEFSMLGIPFFDINTSGSGVVTYDAETDQFITRTDRYDFFSSSGSSMGYVDTNGFNGVGSQLTGFTASQIPIIDINSKTSGTLAANRIANLPASKITSGTLNNARLDNERPFLRLYATASGEATYIQSDAQVFMDTGYNEIAQIDNVNGLSINKIQAKTGNDVTINDNLKVDKIIPNTGDRITLGSSALYSPYVNNSTYDIHLGVVRARTGNLNFYADNFNVFPLAGGASKFSVNGFGVVQADDGSGIEKLNASYLFSGTINNARLPSTISVTTLVGAGSGITGLNADNIALGTINNDRLPLGIYQNQGGFNSVGTSQIFAAQVFGGSLVSPPPATLGYAADTHQFTDYSGASTYATFNNTGLTLGGDLTLNNANEIQTQRINFNRRANWAWSYYDTTAVQGADSFIWRTRDNITNVMFLNTATGRLGIGTTDPTYKLDVAGIASCSTLRIDGGAGRNYQSGTIYTDDNWGMLFRGIGTELLAEFRWDNNAGTERMRMVAGRLGIGTPAPQRALHVANGGVYLQNGTTEYLMDASDTYETSTDIFKRATNHYFQTTGATRLATINSTGMSIGDIAPSTFKLRVSGAASFNSRVRISNTDDPTIEFCRGGTNLTHDFGSTGSTDYRIRNDAGILKFQSRVNSTTPLDHFQIQSISGLGMVRIINNLGVGVAPNTGYRIDLGTNGGNIRGTTFHSVSASHETYYLSYGIDHYFTDYSIACATAGKNLILNTNGGEILSNSPILLTDSSGTGTARPNQMFGVWTDEKFGMELQYRKGTWNTTFITRDFDGGFLFATDEGDEVFYIDSRNGGNSRIAYGESGEYINLTRIGVEPSIFPSENNFGYCGTETQAWYFVWTNFLRVRDNLYGGYDNGSGNFHIDSVEGAGAAIYLNWYGGSNGTRCGNGSSGYGPVYASSYPGTSDDRLKHNEEDIVDALGTINKLKLQKYDKTGQMLDANFNGDLGDIPHEKEIGFIAQDIQQIPELAFLVKEQGPIPVKAEGPVLEGEERLTIQQEQPLTLNYQGINSLAVQAIQELSAVVKAQQTMILDMKTELDNLKSQHISNNE